MLRISEVGLSENAKVLRLEGEVIGVEVEEVRRIVELPLAAGVRLKLDLAELQFVDRHGIALLRELAGRQVELINCSPFLTEQLKEAFASQTGNSGE